MMTTDASEKQIDALIAQMTPEEKVGQVFLLAFSGSRTDEARRLFVDYGIGASYISSDNIPTPQAAAALSRTLQGFAAQTRLRLPLLLGADQEGSWGVMVPHSATGPGNMALGACADPAVTEAMYGVIARELRAVGLNMLFAPCADCNSNPANVCIGMRSFGEPPALVGALTAAAVRGVRQAGVVATVKHFPGHGDTATDSHRGIPRVERDRAALQAIDLLPFAQGIAAGAEMVMTSHILFPALDPNQPATLSRIILQDVLRGQLGFDGVVLSDSMNMQAIRRNYALAEAEIAALQAGVDLIMLAEEHYNHDAARYLEQQTAMLDRVAEAVRTGVIAAERIDDAVRRVLRLKVGLGSAQDEAARARSPEIVGSAEHRAVELRAARESVAVLRGADRFAPLSANAPFALVNTTARAAYAPIDKTRGIGPSQSTPAFDLFVQALQARTATFTLLTAEEVLAGALPPLGVPVVAVTENYPLPGMDFDQHTQAPVIQRLAQAAPGRLTVVALRDPYELVALPAEIVYVCAFSFRSCAAQAAAEVMLGERVPVGHSPVSVPGTEVRARG